MDKEIIEYKGFEIEVMRDDMARSPDEDGDDGLFLVGYHPDFTVDRSRGKRDKETGRWTVTDRGIPVDLARAIANGGKDENGDIDYEAKDYIKKYHIFGLEAYIHSGVCLALSHEGNFPDRQWDVSQLGLVFASRKEWKRRDKARKAALGLIETWNQYLSGDVWGFNIPGMDESSWGYYGEDGKEEMIAEAKDAIDHHIAEAQKIIPSALGA